MRQEEKYQANQTTDVSSSPPPPLTKGGDEAQEKGKGYNFWLFSPPLFQRKWEGACVLLCHPSPTSCGDGSLS